MWTDMQCSQVWWMECSVQLPQLSTNPGTVTSITVWLVWTWSVRLVQAGDAPPTHMVVTMACPCLRYLISTSQPLGAAGPHPQAALALTMSSTDLSTMCLLTNACSSSSSSRPHNPNPLPNNNSSSSIQPSIINSCSNRRWLRTLAAPLVACPSCRIMRGGGGTILMDRGIVIY